MLSTNHYPRYSGTKVWKSGTFAQPLKAATVMVSLLLIWEIGFSGGDLASPGGISENLSPFLGTCKPSLSRGGREIKIPVVLSTLVESHQQTLVGISAHNTVRIIKMKPKIKDYP